MKIKKFFKWPKEIYMFWIASFIMGIDLIGPILLIFFKDWGGLNQTQIQMLQSWFMLWTFILEIPTGAFGDVRGKKFSVIIGYALTILGALAYSIVPNIWIFAFAEFLFAMGASFVSGALEAWMYDISKKLKIEDKFREISVTNNNLKMIGMIVASLLFIPLIKVLPVEQIFRLKIVSTGISLILLGVFVPKTDGKREKSLKPDYIGTAKRAFKLLKENINLRKITIYLSILGSTSYFVIWLYQEALEVLNQPSEMFGVYRMVLLVAEIVMIRIGAILIKKYNTKKVYIGIAVIVALGFLLASILKSPLGVLFLLILSGGLGLQINGLFSKELNEEIESDERATVLSFLGMVRRLLLTAFNPIIGFLVDSKGVFVAFTVLGVFSLLGVFLRPKFKLK
jgi:MFS family permease